MKSGHDIGINFKELNCQKCLKLESQNKILREGLEKIAEFGKYKGSIGKTVVDFDLMSDIAKQTLAEADKLDDVGDPPGKAAHSNYVD